MSNEKKDHVALPPGNLTREEALAIAWELVEAMEARRLLDEAEESTPEEPPDR